VWIADPDGTTSDAQHDAAVLAIQTQATPLTVTVTVINAVQRTFRFTLTVYSKSPLPTQDQVLTAMTDFFASVPIGGVDIGAGGKLYLDGISGAIHDAFVQVRLVQFATELDNGVPVVPPADSAVSVGEVVVLTSVPTDITIVEVA
jgi:hypothetical protein